jgi:hypothetical protein
VVKNVASQKPLFFEKKVMASHYPRLSASVYDPMEVFNAAAFNALSVGEQYLYLVNRCSLVAQRSEGSELLLNLFRADTWYVEVCYHRSTDQVGVVRAFDDVRLLEPYLDCFYLAAC